VLKGLASDGGLFLPEEVPIVEDWVSNITCYHLTSIINTDGII
jgi:hypothetical protein